MKKFVYKISGITIALTFLFLGNIFSASADTSFSFSVPEGQGGSSNEFYHGRCVRADVMLDADGENTGGADLEINYDNSRITIVNSDCSTVATTIYHDSQYDNYTNNNVTATKITLGAYNNPGNIYNGSGRCASFYFTVLDGLGDYDLDFEFTLGSTTDTNLAEFGTGNEILDQADSYTLHFVDDNDTPYVNNENPFGGATGVSVISNILYRLNDDDAGVNFSTLAQRLAGVNWGVTNYTAGSGQITHTCNTTNANRIPYCDTTLNPTNNLYYCENYTVDISVSDLGNPTVHTLNNYTYNFDTEPDNDAPEIYNRNPNDGAVNVATATNIDLNIRDLANPGGYPGTGVNISTLSVNVSAPDWGNQTYTTASAELTATPLSVNDYGNVYDYAISIDTSVDFPENTLVIAVVAVDDYGCPAINHQQQTYTFTTADTIGPVCTLITPTPNAVNMGTADDVTFRCADSGSGVDINTIEVIVDGVRYTATGTNQFTYTGSSADYLVTVNPASDFVIEYALEVIVNAQDFSGNNAEQMSSGLATGVNGTCPVCPICDTCDTCDDCEDCEDCDECEDCDDCDECKDTVETITKYKECSVIEKIMKDNAITKWLPAQSKITTAQLDGITLKKINDIDIDDEKKALVIVHDDIVIFEGNALPNVQVTLMIESNPIIVTGVADDNGNWKIETANIFVNGTHKVSAVTMSEDNYIVKTKYLADFKIQRNNNCPIWCCVVIGILGILLIITFYKYRKFKKIKENEIT